jgi:hypothetical protein
MTKSSTRHLPNIARLKYCELVNAKTAAEHGVMTIADIQHDKNAKILPNL